MGDTVAWLKVVGTGPGKVDYLTLRAFNVLKQADIIIGYQKYTDLIKDEFADKQMFDFGMGDEYLRAQKAVELYTSGNKVAVISGGDAGLYGIASIVIEKMTELDIDFEKAEFEVVPGVTSATAVSNLFGSVLTQDFAIISLSDYLVAWEEIEKRLVEFSKLDISIAIYNPISSKRIQNFEKALEILKKYRTLDTLIIVCENAYRDSEKSFIVRLKDLKKEHVNMNTILIVCPSNARVITNSRKSYVLVPRYYRKESESMPKT